MNIRSTIAALGGMLAMAAAGPVLAQQYPDQPYHDQGYHDQQYHDQQYHDQQYHGRHYHDRASYDRRYHHCSGGNGAVGTVAGGVGGALIGNAVGGGALGTIGGGIGGALLGRTLDKSNTKSRHGC